MNRTLKNRLEVAREMPKLFHTVRRHEGAQFRIEDSEVLKWLATQPELLDFLREKLFKRGLIEYDSNGKFWKGCPPWTGGGPVPGRMGSEKKFKVDDILDTIGMCWIVGLKNWYNESGLKEEMCYLTFGNLAREAEKMGLIEVESGRRQRWNQMPRQNRYRRVMNEAGQPSDKEDVERARRELIQAAGIKGGVPPDSSQEKVSESGSDMGNPITEPVEAKAVEPVVAPEEKVEPVAPEEKLSPFKQYQAQLRAEQAAEAKLREQRLEEAREIVRLEKAAALAGQESGGISSEVPAEAIARATTEEPTQR